MGFSIVGLTIVMCILAPNILYSIYPPYNIPAGMKDKESIFTIFERLGQFGCIFLLIVLKDSIDDNAIDIYFILMTICIVFYYFLWIRYFVQGRSLSSLFKPLGMIPIPMAFFPVLAYAFAALWLQSIWLAVAVILLAIGHLVNSWKTYTYIKGNH
ncbi:hypothetical protein [Robertmurraya massiliosenegalensis]|uniref:hypothetical protein n=1 Tax=Robertmurraya massiliosenegalensis TaxID=1287657 RepID=UPI00037B2ABB|nr:hypothetical protein [Robertmurraya massiliosenegalensis]